MSRSTGTKGSGHKTSASNAANRRRTPADDLATPGTALRELLLEKYDITQDELAQAMGTTRYSVNEILNDARALTAEMALRIARVTDTSAEFWLRLQMYRDLRSAESELRTKLAAIAPLRQRASG